MPQENWKDIHEDFGEKWYSDKTYQQRWEENGLTYQDAQEWIPIGFEPYDYYKIKKWKENFSATEVKLLIEGSFEKLEHDQAQAWKYQGFTSQQIQVWIQAGLNPQELSFANHLKQKNIQPNHLSTEKLFELRKEFYPSYPQAQAYLDQNYPCNCDGKWNHQENCPQKNLEEINLRNLQLEGDLDLRWSFNHSEIYLTGNPRLGEVKNFYGGLVYQNFQEYQNYLDYNKNQIKKIGWWKLAPIFKQSGELIINNYPNLEEVITVEEHPDTGSLVKSFPNITKIIIKNCPKLKEISIGLL